MNGNPRYQEFIRNFTEVKRYLSSRGEWDLMSIGQRQNVVSEFKQVQKSFYEVSDGFALLALPWCDIDAFDGDLVNDLDKILVAVRCRSGVGDNSNEWWEYHVLTACCEKIGTWFITEEGDHFKLDDVEYFIDATTLDNSLPV